MADINLLPSEEKVSEKLGSLQKKFTFFSVFVMVVVAAATVATLFMFTAVKAEETKLTERHKKAAEEVNSHLLSEELLTVIDKKAESATKARSSRLVYTNILRRTAELMPLGVSFEDLKVDGLKMSAGASASSSAEVANLVSSFVTSDEGKKLFTSMNIDSLSTDKDGQYRFGVSMQLNNTASCSLVPLQPGAISAGQEIKVSSNSGLFGDIGLVPVSGNKEPVLLSKLAQNEDKNALVAQNTQPGEYEVIVGSPDLKATRNTCGKVTVNAASAPPEGI